MLYDACMSLTTLKHVKTVQLRSNFLSSIFWGLWTAVSYNQQTHFECLFYTLHYTKGVLEYVYVRVRLVEWLCLGWILISLSFFCSGLRSHILSSTIWSFLFTPCYKKVCIFQIWFDMTYHTVCLNTHTQSDTHDLTAVYNPYCGTTNTMVEVWYCLWNHVIFYICNILILDCSNLVSDMWSCTHSKWSCTYSKWSCTHPKCWWQLWCHFSWAGHSQWATPTQQRFCYWKGMHKPCSKILFVKGKAWWSDWLLHLFSFSSHSAYSSCLTNLHWLSFCHLFSCLLFLLFLMQLILL